MAFLDSADLLARLRVAIRQPSTSDVSTDAQCYSWLGQGQIDLFTRLAIFAPKACIITPRQVTTPAARTVASTTTNGSTTVGSSALFLLNDIGAAISGTGIPAGALITGVNSTSSIIISVAATVTGSPTLTLTPESAYPYTFTFGTDADGNDLYPVGAVALYRVRNDIPDAPMVEGVEYQMEGNHIRMPDYAAFSGTAPYFQCMVLPLTLSATVSPTLLPVQARELIVDSAAVRYAQEIEGQDPSIFEARFEKSWSRYITAIQLQYARSGSVAASHPTYAPTRGRWYGRAGPAIR